MSRSHSLVATISPSEISGATPASRTRRRRPRRRRVGHRLSVSRSLRGAPGKAEGRQRAGARHRADEAATRDIHLVFHHFPPERSHLSGALRLSSIQLRTFPGAVCLATQHPSGPPLVAAPPPTGVSRILTPAPPAGVISQCFPRWKSLVRKFPTDRAPKCLQWFEETREDHGCARNHRWVAVPAGATSLVHRLIHAVRHRGFTLNASVYAHVSSYCGIAREIATLVNAVAFRLSSSWPLALRDSSISDS